MLLKACLNGDRSQADHPAVPVTPEELAADAAAAVDAGAGALHVHPRDGDGNETLVAASVGAAVDAIRAATARAVPVGVSTGAWFTPDPADRIAHIRRWTVLPDFASVNLHEEGAVDVARTLLDRGVAVEAGVWTPEAAEILVDSGLLERSLRILLEPMEDDVSAALVTVDAIERRLDGAPPPRLLHGTDATAWPLLRHAVARGYDMRIGLEDTLARPDGTPAAGNAELVRLAVAMATTS